MPFLRRNGHGGDTNAPGRSAWTPIVRSVMRHPVAAMAVATVALVALASPAARLHLGEMDTSVLPSNLDGVKAVEALQTHWPGGTLLRLNVVVTEADEHSKKEAVDRLGSALVTIPGLSGPALVSTSPDGSAASISVVMSGAANDPANWEIVRRVRSNLVPETVGGLAGVRAYVGGDAATAMDQTQIYTDGMGRVFLFVLGFSFVLLLLVFHSIAIPVKAILMNLLATGAAFGALVLVFEEGWFASLLGVKPTAVVQDWVPIFIFTILFGLSMDYEVFLISRIQEEWLKSGNNREAVRKGLAATGKTITAAALIMILVFGSFILGGQRVIKEFGLGLAGGILVDAFIIRVAVVPSLMFLFGKANWWFPGWLDRILPHVAVDPETAEAGHDAGGPAAPAEPESVPV
jgi:RND superfamily putative drug exporter